jgi:hypothetical protein
MRLQRKHRAMRAFVALFGDGCSRMNSRTF